MAQLPIDSTNFMDPDPVDMVRPHSTERKTQEAGGSSRTGPEPSSQCLSPAEVVRRLDTWGLSGRFAFQELQDGVSQVEVVWPLWHSRA